jgi:hypothetical protein
LITAVLLKLTGAATPLVFVQMTILTANNTAALYALLYFYFGNDYSDSSPDCTAVHAAVYSAQKQPF